MIRDVSLIFSLFSSLVEVAILCHLHSFAHFRITLLPTMKLLLTLLASLLACAVAYQPAKVPNRAAVNKAKVASAAATAALSVLLSTGAPAFASDTAAQITLDQIPPSSINVEIGDLPIIGNILSGTYTKVPDNSFKGKPAVTIKSPSDKVKAIKDIASGGHFEFDVGGKIKTHLDVDVAADEPGVARVRVASNLIPSLPYRNLASSKGSPTGGKESEWNIVTNLGSGDSYYFNMKTGVTQLERPEKL